MRLALAAIAVCLSLAVPGAAPAKESSKKAATKKKADKKKGAKKQPDSADAMYMQISGKPQPLPKPTDLSLHFEVEAADAEAYAIEVTAAAAATQTTESLAWTIADWRRQMANDLKWLAYYRRLLAGEVRKSQRDGFPVAERYLTGLFDATDQFSRLAKQSAEQFDAEFPADRSGETMTATPEAARRVRLYRDRAQALFGRAKAFVERTVKGRDEKIVRLESK